MAIEFNNATDGWANSSFSHTVGNGSNRLLVAMLRGGTQSNQETVSATYNGVSMTKIGSVQIPGDRWLHLFYLLNPDTGTHTISFSDNYGVNRTACASYFGVKQSGQPDAYAINTANGTTSFSCSLTTNADNAWLIGIGSSVNNIPSAGSNTIIRVNTNATTISDSNSAQTPPGSHSLNWNIANSDNWAAIIASFAPAITAVGKSQGHIF